MTDNAMRHMVAAIATIVCLLAYFGGYASGLFGWWWTSFAVLIVYGAVYKIIKK